MSEVLNELKDTALDWTKAIHAKGQDLIDDVVTEGKIIAGGAQKAQGNYFSSRVFTQLTGLGFFIVSAIIFFRDIIPTLTPRNVEVHTGKSRHFTQVWLQAKHPGFSVALFAAGTIFFIYTQRKEYWNDPKYIQEQRVDFLQSSHDFTDLFKNTDHLNKLLKYGSITPQETRNKFEEKLAHASHLEFVEWVLELKLEDLIAYKNQGIIDEKLFIDFSIGRSPLVFLDLISILDISYWFIFFYKLIESKVLSIGKFQKKLAHELEPFTSYSELIKKVAWKKLKLLLENAWLPEKKLQAITENSGITDIKLLLQEESLSGILESGAFKARQLSSIVERELLQSANLHDALRSLPVATLIKFHDEGLLDQKLFTGKLTACDSLSFRNVINAISVEQIELLIEKELFPPQVLKEKLLQDIETLHSLEYLVEAYGLEHLVFFLDKGFLDLEVTSHLKGSGNIPYDHLLLALQDQSHHAIELLEKLINYKLISLEQVQKQLTSFFLSFRDVNTIFLHFNFAFIKALINSKLLVPEELAKLFLTHLRSEGLVNFIIANKWTLDDLNALFNEETSNIINEAFVVSLSVYHDFFHLLHDFPWYKLQTFLSDFKLNTEPLSQLFTKSTSHYGLQDVFQLTSPEQLEEMLQSGVVSKPTLVSLFYKLVESLNFFEVLHLLSEAELSLLLDNEVISPKQLRAVFLDNTKNKNYQEIELLFTENFFLLQFVKQKDSLLKRLKIQKDIQQLDKLLKSNLPVAEKAIMWEAWKKTPLSTFSQIES